jgi:hypothetical protein
VAVRLQMVNRMVECFSDMNKVDPPPSGAPWVAFLMAK